MLRRRIQLVKKTRRSKKIRKILRKHRCKIELLKNLEQFIIEMEEEKRPIIYGYPAYQLTNFGKIILYKYEYMLYKKNKSDDLRENHSKSF